MKRIRKPIALSLVAAGITFGTLAVAQSARADDGTRTVAWLVTSGSFDNRFGTPQTLYAGSLECGTGLLQVDVYDTSTPEHAALVQALIDGGTLTSGQDTPVYLSNQDVELTPCATPTASTPASTTPTMTTPPVTKPPVEPTPTPTHSSGTPPVHTTRPTAPPTAPATAPATSPTTAATSPSHSATNPMSQPSTLGGSKVQKVNQNAAADSLAYTGSNTGPELAAGILATLSGLVLLICKRKKA
jgi:hypothetical protein